MFKNCLGSMIHFDKYLRLCSSVSQNLCFQVPNVQIRVSGYPSWLLFSSQIGAAGEVEKPLKVVFSTHTASCFSSPNRFTIYLQESGTKKPIVGFVPADHQDVVREGSSWSYVVSIGRRAHVEGRDPSSTVEDGESNLQAICFMIFMGFEYCHLHLIISGTHLGKGLWEGWCTQSFVSPFACCSHKAINVLIGLSTVDMNPSDFKFASQIRWFLWLDFTSQLGKRSRLSAITGYHTGWFLQKLTVG